METNTLYFGDNLDILRHYIQDGSVDLIYLDPPFNSNQDYNVLFEEKDGTRSAAQITAFEDTWHWNLQESEQAYQEVVEAGGNPSLVLQAFRKFLGQNDMMAYLAMMAPRLIELRRVLKHTGSIYVHCDPTASHYLKMLMDSVFSFLHFRNEIVWKRSYAHSSAKRFSPVHDILLFYSKGDRPCWNPAYQPLPQETIDQWYNNVEPITGRRFNRADLTAAGVRSGPSGQPWRGSDPTAKGRHWAIPGLVGSLVKGLDTQQALDALDAAGRIFWPKRSGGMPMLKRYLEEAKGIPALDVITDIPPLNNVAAERLGYPTQKPQALLEKIIKASSNLGDIVLDPFCGCGTSVAAAEKLKRRWIGIDITYLAINLIRRRLHDAYGDEIQKTYEVIGEPKDLEGARALAESDPYQFQFWLVDLVGGRTTDHKKGADQGIDGRIFFHDEPATRSGRTKQMIIQVKAGHVTSAHIRDLRGVLQREKAQIGVLLTMEEPSKPMLKEAASAGIYKSGWGNHPVVQILTVEQLLSGTKIDAPPLRHTGQTFRKAPKIRTRDDMQKEITFDEHKAKHAAEAEPKPPDEEIEEADIEEEPSDIEE